VRSRLLVPCSELSKRGLPKLKPVASRYGIVTQFKEWVDGSAAEYAFALGEPGNNNFEHTVWTFIEAGTRYVVPALALMRALFRPTHALLPALYRPQSLEDVCTASVGNGDSHVQLLSALGDVRHRSRASLLMPMSWYFCFPSARQAWASVYLYGRQGRLGLTLPRAAAKLVLKGVARGQNFYVSGITVLSVDALEEPFEFASSHARTILFAAKKHKAGPRSPTLKATFPLGQGTSALSDDEWRAVSEVLGTGERGSGVRLHAIRHLVDAILKKLCHGTSWPQTAYRHGVTHSAASTALHRWRARGNWTQVEALLRAKRSAPRDDIEACSV
jgi:hypothetical protein